VREQHPDIVAELEKLGDEAREDLGDDIQKRTGRNNRPAGTVSN